MRRASAVLALGAILPCNAAAAEDDDFDARVRALAESKGCMECHAVGYRDVGPSFRSIADRYRFDPLARDRLPYVIRGGSAGHWGERFVMWPQPRISAGEARQLVDWVLAQ
jgi:cytochrome c